MKQKPGFKFTKKRGLVLGVVGGLLVIGLNLWGLQFISINQVPAPQVNSAAGESRNIWLATIENFIANNIKSEFTAGKLSPSANPTITASPTPSVSPTSSPTVKPGTPTPTPSKTPTPTPSPSHSPTPSPTFTPTLSPSPTPSTASCPLTTMNCVPCTSGSSCRIEPGHASGYQGWACQDNNPGNIRYSQSRINLITAYGGTAPCGIRCADVACSSNYMIFSTYSNGRNGLMAYIRAINAGAHSSYVNCGNCTLTYFFSVYSPSGYTTYVNAVVAQMGGGVTPDTLLSWVVQNRLGDFVDAIQTHEGWFVQ